MIAKIKVCGYRIYKKFELVPNTKLNLIVVANEVGTPALVEALTLAFTDRIDRKSRSAKHERLFPHLPNSTGLGFGRQLSRQFSTYIKGQGVSEEGMGFHAFRHTFATLLDRAGETTTAISRLTGHWDGQAPPPVLERFYIDRETLPLRVATLAKFVPSVAAPEFERGMFQVID